MSPRFHHWTYLNDEGKKIYGSVFPDGTVPVVSMVPTVGKLGGQAQSMFKVDLKQLSQNQIDALLDLMSRKFHAPRESIKKQLDKDGYIPLRQSLTSGSGTDQMGLFF